MNAEQITHTCGKKLFCSHFSCSVFSLLNRDHIFVCFQIEGTVISVPSKHPGQTLIAMAREEQAIAIIMGSRGLSKLKKVRYGTEKFHLEVEVGL